MKRLILFATAAVALMAAPPVHAATRRPASATVPMLRPVAPAAPLSSVAARAGAVIAGARFEQHRGGYRPLDLDMKITPGRTVNYRGELQRGAPGK